MSLFLGKKRQRHSLALKFGMFSRGRIGVLALSQVGMLNILRLCLYVCKKISLSQLKEYHELLFVCFLSLTRSRSQLHSQSSNVTGFSLFFYLKATYTECYVFCIIINMS